MTALRCLLLLTMTFTLAFALESFEAEDGYETFPELPGSRYKLYPITLTWPEALSLCQSDGGGAHLVINNSDEEAAIVKQMFDRISASVAYLFVGIDDLAQRGTWVTVQGGLVSASGFNQWSPGEPDNAKTQHCGIILRNGLYGSHDCDDNRPFLCEKPDV